MKTNVSLLKIWGIPIGLNASWFLIFGLLSFSLASGLFPLNLPGLPGPTYWVLGAVTCLFFFSSVLAHELGHAFVALREGIPVRRIVLFIFGGVAEITQEPRTAGAEFRIAAAGPLVSLALAGLFGAVSLLQPLLPALAEAASWLARTNLLLAIFNLIPGYPLDGGRIFRSLVWRISGSAHRATTIAATGGQIVAYGFIAFGIFSVFTGGAINGLWLGFIGWFLLNAATSSVAQANLMQMLRGVTVYQVMSRQLPHVPSKLSIRRLVDEYVLQNGQERFAVADDGEILGLLSVQDLAKIEPHRWPFMTVSQAMAPFERLAHISPWTEIAEALHLIEARDALFAPVISQGQVIGTLSREDVQNYIRLRTALRA